MKLVEDFEPPENKEITVKTSGGLKVVAMYRAHKFETYRGPKGHFYLKDHHGVIVDAVWWEDL